jgi:phosphoglycolate phosphatase
MADRIKGERRIRGVLFDKDGTLFGFQESWAPPFAGLLADLSGGDAALAERLARAAGYDRGAAAFEPHSVVIAGTLQEVAGVLAPHLPGRSTGAVAARLEVWATGATMAPVTELGAFADGLRAAGLLLGVATNDSESAARAHLAAHLHRFDYIAGYDSGHGAKPGPGMIAAFCRAVSLAPAQVAMVGDSLHDLAAARAAGVAAVAVLTGVAGRETLAPHADVVLESIRDLPRWLDV